MKRYLETDRASYTYLPEHTVPTEANRPAADLANASCRLQYILGCNPRRYCHSGCAHQAGCSSRSFVVGGGLLLGRMWNVLDRWCNSVCMSCAALHVFSLAVLKGCTLDCSCDLEPRASHNNLAAAMTCRYGQDSSTDMSAVLHLGQRRHSPCIRQHSGGSKLYMQCHCQPCKVQHALTCSSLPCTRLVWNTSTALSASSGNAYCTNP